MAWAWRQTCIIKSQNSWIVASTSLVDTPTENDYYLIVSNCIGLSKPWYFQLIGLTQFMGVKIMEAVANEKSSEFNWTPTKLGLSIVLGVLTTVGIWFLAGLLLMLFLL